jgi:hypothetical protein
LKSPPERRYVHEHRVLRFAYSSSTGADPAFTDSYLSVVNRTNRAMTLFTSLGPLADCRGLTQVPTYQVRIGSAHGAAFSVSQRGFSLSLGLQGKVARTPHQSKGSDGKVWYH